MSTNVKVSKQLHDNIISIISLIVALIALTHSAWREQETEKNRNIRPAAFEVLKHLGELQIIVNYSHYEPESKLADPFMGWGHVALIQDMSQILPTPMPTEANRLVEVWRDNWKKIQSDEAATQAISNEIDTLRESAVKVMTELR